MCWICFLILRAQDCTLDIRLGTLLPIFMRVTKDCRDLTFCIQWDSILLVFQRNNMRFKPGNIQRLQPKKILHDTEINWIKLVFPSIGIAKFVLHRRNITNGRNGFLNNYLIAITIILQIKQSEFQR